MADKLFPTDYTEVTTTQTTDFTPVYREWEELYKIKTESLKWLDGACVESVSFVWNDMVFVLDDASTVTLVWAKTALVGTDWVWISSIIKTWTVWLVDTYTITYTDSSTSTFNVTNGTNWTNGTDGADWVDGRWIVSILKTNTVWVTDTYTITYTDSTTSTFNVTNGTNWTNGTDWEDWISFTPKWEYSSGTAYVPNDVVSYLGSSWIALQNTTGNIPSEWAYWTLNAAKGADGTGSGDISGSGTANEIAYFTAEKTIDNLPVATYPSLTELSYVKWVTSAIQTQIWNQVPKSLYDANTIIKADTDNTPAALTVWEQTLVGRKTWWVITALTPTEVRTMINVADWATANTKATWAEIDTWTDDDKYVTAKAMKDSAYLSSMSDVTAASDTVAWKIEVATTAETNTWTDNGRAVSPDGLAWSYAGTKWFSIIAVAPTTDLTVADGKAYVTIPECMNGMNLIRANAVVNTAGTTNATTIDIYNVTDSHDMLSTAISIASGWTVGTAWTVDTSYDDVATNDVLRIDVTSMSTTAPKGLMVVLEFRLP